MGCTALALRTAFLEDECSIWNNDCQITSPTPLGDNEAGGISVNYLWELTAPPTHTAWLGDTTPSAFSWLKPTQWRIEITSNEGKLTAHVDTPLLQAKDKTQQVITQYGASFLPSTTRYLPNGKKTQEHRLLLQCRVTINFPFWQPPVTTTAQQILIINPALGTVDLLEIHQPDYLPANRFKLIVDGAPTPDLPSRYCGSAHEQALQYLLYEFADAIGAQDKERIQQYMLTAEQYVNHYCLTDLDWPNCWSDGAAEARRGATLIEQTLTHLQDNNCLDMPELADFINGPIFARIFGTELKKREKIDFGDKFDSGIDTIEFEEITEGIQTTEGTKDEKN